MKPAFTPQRHAQLLVDSRDALLGDVIPFWLRHGLDREHGGLLSALDRRGEVVDDDKAVWIQGRAAWMFGLLHNTVEARAEWRDAALSCATFLHERCRDASGKFYFQVTRDGRPVRMRRYAYSECFAAIGFAETHVATGDAAWRRRALDAFEAFVAYTREPGRIAPKVDPTTRPAEGLGPRMMLLVTAQDLRDALGECEVRGRSLTEWARLACDEIVRLFVKPDLRVVMEQVAPDGSIYDHFDGRTLNPGHAIEAAWFVLREARRSADAKLAAVALQMLDWMFERGWDREHGGLLYFVDLHGKPVQEYWHFLKFWWPHNELLIAALLAYVHTGDERYAQMHARTHEWAYGHFADRECGEWYGYLDRRGEPTSTLKGNLWKGPFHLPRQLLWCWRLLEGQNGPRGRG